MIKVKNLSFSYGNKNVLKDISFNIKRGSMLGIIGPNGSGKTTLLSIISGLFTNYSGEVLYNNKSLQNYSKKELARNFAFLEQESTPHLSFTVEEIVSMGRYPWQRRFFQFTQEDYGLIDDTLNRLDISNLKEKPIYTLSGGERQLVSLARTMVQEPKLLFLDEPTNYLDINHQQMVMKYIKKWKEETNLTVVMVLHDLNLASIYCEELLLLNDGRKVIISATEQVLNQNNLEKVYKTELITIKHPKNNKTQILLP